MPVAAAKVQHRLGRLHRDEMPVGKVGGEFQNLRSGPSAHTQDSRLSREFCKNGADEQMQCISQRCGFFKPAIVFAGVIFAKKLLGYGLV